MTGLSEFWREELAVACLKGLLASKSNVTSTTQALSIYKVKHPETRVGSLREYVNREWRGIRDHLVREKALGPMNGRFSKVITITNRAIIRSELLKFESRLDFAKKSKSPQLEIVSVPAPNNCVKPAPESLSEKVQRKLVDDKIREHIESQDREIARITKERNEAFDNLKQCKAESLSDKARIKELEEKLAVVTKERDELWEEMFMQDGKLNNASAKELKSLGVKVDPEEVKDDD
jgi:chorismate mutase